MNAATTTTDEDPATKVTVADGGIGTTVIERDATIAQSWGLGECGDEGENQEDQKQEEQMTGHGGWVRPAGEEKI